MKFNYAVKVPKDRIAILVGTKGSIKNRIQKELNVKLVIDSEEGDVDIEGEDSLNLLTAQNIVRAIGRGFNPEIAFDLLNENNHFESLDIEEYVGDSKSKLTRIRARVIGEGGTARKTIEDLTCTSVSVYGKTISIIGDYEGVSLARRAFESLLNGSRHSTVYSMLEKQRKKLKM